MGKYICQYTKGGKNVALGTFDDKDHEAAARVYDTKVRAAMSTPRNALAHPAPRCGSWAARR